MYKLALFLAVLSSAAPAQPASTPSPMTAVPGVQQLRVLLVTAATVPELNNMTERAHQLQKNWALCLRATTLRVVRFLHLRFICPEIPSQKNEMLYGLWLGVLGFTATGFAYKKFTRHWTHRVGVAGAALLCCLAMHDYGRALVVAKQMDRLEQRDYHRTNQCLAVLAGLNIPFEVWAVSQRSLQLSDVVAQDTLRYHLVIVACSREVLPEETQQTLTAIAKAQGIRIVESLGEERQDRRRLVELLTHAAAGAVRPAMGGTMALRMDDPGAPIKAYLDEYRHNGLSPENWHEVVGILEKQNAGLSVFYVPGWVDDGDSSRGALEYHGEIVTPRSPGKIYDAKDVVYTVHEDGVRMDQVAEYEILKSADATIAVESHAHTHMEMDLARWLLAADKYSNKAWYRELYHLYDDRDLTAAETRAVLQQSSDKITAWFEHAPTTLVPPGHKISRATLGVAGKMGFRLLSMNTVFLLDSTQYIEASDVRNPSFEQWQDFDTTLIADGFPTVGYFHDRDIAVHGSAWFADGLKGWQKVGIKRFDTFRELTGLLRAKVKAQVEMNRISGWVDISGTGGIGDDWHGRYFAAHALPLQVTLPAGRRATGIVVNDSTRTGFKSLSPREIVLQLPPFGAAARQKFVIELE